MARTRFKCQFIICFCLIFLDTVRSLPIRSPILETTDSAYQNVPREKPLEIVNTFTKEIETETTKEVLVNSTRSLENRSLLRQNIRPGQEARNYNILIRRNGANFEGRAVIDVQVTEATRNNPLFFNFMEVTVSRVQVGLMTSVNAVDANFRFINQGLEITPPQTSSSYVVIVEYSAPLKTNGFGLFLGQYDEAEDYIAMNLHPTNSRRVFPSMDEPNISSITSFTFEGFEYNTIISNSMSVEVNQTSFRPLEGPSHLWGMVAHNFENIIRPVSNVLLYVRPGVTNQEAQAAVAISNFYGALNLWTEKPYTEIILNQDGNIHVMALPDVSRDWYALSTVCIWEPYMLMETTGSVMQRKLVILNIAEAMSRQWFGYVLRPENWRHHWIIDGLTSYAAYDIAKNFQIDPEGVDETLIDVNAIFTTDVIQESLLLDSYTSAQPLETASNVFVENSVRLHVNGLNKYKAPALLRMFRLILGDADTDVIQRAARALMSSRALQPLSSQIFYDAINGVRTDNNLVGLVNEFMQTWVNNNGYPVVNVGLRQGGVILTQERFGLSTISHVNFLIPITYTTSAEPDFDNLRPTMMLSPTTTLDFNLGEEDWLLMNLQGQAYYRVNYDAGLWERIIMALEDPERREEIHPLNRASLLDDSLNLARAGKIDYEIPFRIVLTMEHELDYAVWRTFVRNMEFMRKRLIPFASVNADRDDEIYLRLIRRIIILVEEQLGFTPDNAALEPAMQTLTRGLVMDHACRSGYDPCIAAAVDLFYDPDDGEAVNPNIQREIRPAVYCTMVREGDEAVRQALINRMELEASKYERLIILESLACSQDANFINTYLEETVAANSPYALEERKKIFEAVASSSAANARLALNFMTTRTNNIRNSYGGPDKLEESIFVLADNMVDAPLASDFGIWVNSLATISNLQDSNLVAIRARNMITENLAWNDNRIQEAYDWIDLNHAPTIFVSTFLITLSLFIALFNY